TISDIRRESATARATGCKVVLVPTMGSLHAGHLSLIQRARKIAGPKGTVIVSIFVNKIQFDPSEDYRKYPRNLKRDIALCRECGTDIVFAPSEAAIYPEGCSTFVVESRLVKVMEGASRPSHFRGVTTIVAKLFNIVQPDAAVFGAKDWQQSAVVRRMSADLNFPVRIVVAPTVRGRNGLALSSRNRYLTTAEHEQATILYNTIRAARVAVKNAASPLPSVALRRKLIRLVAQQCLAKLDYIEFFDPKTLESVKRVSRGTHLALAVFFGSTRLIDNGRL
ncbi:MAG TPA: pantoate--beta-alanine ligase, partial [Verrucomicrobiota bacterium]|nr:pantoate--beta-alanine ligase [Verrucomicrobiota bacterium]